MTYAFCEDYTRIINNLIRGGVTYIEQNPSIKSMVLGMSGGVDSMVTAYLARKVADKTGIKLYGYILPIETNHHEETFRGIFGASHLCHEHQVWHLDEAYNALAAAVDPGMYGTIPRKRTIWEKIRLGNIKARIRMIFLYNQAAKRNGMVLSTDNYTELLLGFWTLHGDVGDFGFLQNLWKTEVFGMATVIGGDCGNAASAKPTDGLGVSDSDLEQLLPGWEGNDFRAGYKMVDEILMDHLRVTTNMYADSDRVFDKDHPVIQRHLKTKFKRDNPFNISRSAALMGTGPKPKFVDLL